MNQHLTSVVMLPPINIPDGTYDGHWYKFSVYFETPSGHFMGQYPSSSNGQAIEVTIETKNNRLKAIPRQVN